MSFAPFDVVVVPFPYSDSLGEKRRPAVVISAPPVEAEHGWLQLAMVTSAPGPNKIGDANLVDLQAAGLNRICRVRGAKIAVLDAGRVMRKTGALSNGDRRSLSRALADCAGWSGA